METISAAAQRLLQRLEQRAGKEVSGRLTKAPEEIHEISPNAPWADKKAGEIGAYSSLLAGQWPVRGRNGRDLKAVAVCPANDNAGWTSGEYDHRASPTRLYPDANSMPKIARGIHAPGDWEF